MRERYRLYTQHKYKGKTELVTWIQRKCDVCKRFLGKHDHFLCRKCYPSYKKLQDYIWYHADELGIGDVF